MVRHPPKFTPRIWLLKGVACSSAAHVWVSLLGMKCLKVLCTSAFAGTTTVVVNDAMADSAKPEESFIICTRVE